MNKGELRQAYTMFYANEASKIIDEYYKKKAEINPYEGNFSKGYRVYTSIILALFCFAFISIFLKFILGFIFSFVPFFIMIIFMPSKYKKEATEYNNNPKSHCNPEDMQYYFDGEIALKDKLMNKFLSIFGKFSWMKGKSFVDIKDLIILPDKLSLDSDDSIKGEYDDVSVKMTEVYFGFNAIFKTLMNHMSNLNYLQVILPVFFLILCIVILLPTSQSLKATVFFSYTTFFMIVWCLGFFAPLIILFVYLVNRKNRGLLVELDMPKDFSGEIVVFEKGRTNRSVVKKRLKSYEKVELEDIEFSKKYCVYATNQIEARYVLTTALIERLQNIKFKFDAQYLRFTFKNHSMTIFIGSKKDLFKMVQKDKKTDLNTFNELFEEIYSILLLVDELKLNIKTGL